MSNPDKTPEDKLLRQIETLSMWVGNAYAFYSSAAKAKDVAARNRFLDCASPSWDAVIEVVNEITAIFDADEVFNSEAEVIRLVADNDTSDTGEDDGSPWDREINDECMLETDPTDDAPQPA
jgi:hypothetical protein